MCTYAVHSKGVAIEWGGPIVRNTQEELDLAFQELDEGTFIKKKR